MNTVELMHNLIMPVGRKVKVLSYLHGAYVTTKDGAKVHTHDVEFIVSHDGKGVTEIRAVWVLNRLRGGLTDITDTAMKFMDLDNKIEEITDWKELYHNSND